MRSINDLYSYLKFYFIINYEYNLYNTLGAPKNFSQPTILMSPRFRVRHQILTPHNILNLVYHRTYSIYHIG